jgi:signal transduction histidine kinase
MSAGRLAAQLLAIARRQTSQPLSAAIADAFADGLRDLIKHAVDETVQLEISLAPDLWTCQLDLAQFESALLNLVINARDAMPEGGLLTVTACNAPLGPEAASAVGLPPGDYVRVEVIDTGAGIAPEHLSRVLEPFFTTKAVGKGTGLGLAQVHGFVRQFGGTVIVRSTLGSGTTVSLYLPRSE